MSDLILTQLQNSLTSFFDEMIDLFPKEADFIKIRIFLKDQVDIQTVMEVFTYNLNRTDVNHEMTLKKMIKDRNDFDILESPIFLEYFSKEKIIYYKKFWNSPSLFTEDKKMVWKWLDSFVGISERYIKTK